MFDDLDEALRQLLIRELPIKKNEIDIAFEQPKRDWSARVSRPTLNLFLYDLRENLKLRASQAPWENIRESSSGPVVAQKRRPMRVDVRYLVTAWTTEAEDEHRLLARAMLALIRFPTIPTALLPEGLQAQEFPIPLQVAQPETLPNTGDIWSALENTLRPALVLQTTVALDPVVSIPAGPPVRARELRVGQRDQTVLPAQALLAEAPPESLWTVGGTLRVQKGELRAPQVRLTERDEVIPVSGEGRFVIGRLRAGEYTLQVAAEGRRARTFKIKVPAPDYYLDL